MNSHTKTSEEDISPQLSVSHVISIIEKALGSSLEGNNDVIKKIAKEVTEVMDKDRNLMRAKVARDILDSLTSEMVNFQDAQHNILYCNQAFSDFIGQPIISITGKRCFDVLCDPDKCRGKCPIEALKEGKKENFLVEYDGRWVEKSSNKVLGLTGEFLGYVEIYKDVSELHRQKIEIEHQKRLLHDAHDELQKNSEFLVSALNNSRQGIWEWNITTGQVTTDKNFLAILGLDPSIDFDFDIWVSLIHPEDRDKIKKELAKCITNPECSFQFTYRMLHKEGNILNIAVSGKVIEIDEGGMPTRAVGTHMDVTEMMVMRHDLDENERKLNAILQSIPDLLVVVDNVGNYTQIYSGNKKMNIGPRKVGENICSIFDEQNAVLILEAINMAIKSRLNQKIEYQLAIGKRIRKFSGNCQALSDNQVVIVTRDITEENKLQEKIRHLALHDSLTGLENQSSFKDKLQHLIILSKRHKRKFAVLFVDLDLFKQVNDRYGHGIGDKLLQEVAQRLLNATRGSDVVARIGGDEFGIILSDLDNTKDHEIVANRIINSLTREFEIRGLNIKIGASIGISLFPEHGDDIEALLKHADVAMYMVKKGGKNNFLVFEKHFKQDSN